MGSLVNVLRLAVSPVALRRTIPAALVVGSALTAVNSGGRIADGTVDGWVALRIALTFAVPWLNSTYGYVVGRRHAVATALATA